MSRADDDTSVTSADPREIADMEGSEVESSVAFSLVEDALKLNEVCQPLPLLLAAGAAH